MKLLYRTIAAAAALPLIISGAVPAVIIILDPWRRPVFLPGIIVAAAGAVLTFFCVRDFYRRGSGTLAPWDAPEELVVSGLYRLCRNPMYVGVLFTIAGLALLFTSPLLLFYLAAAGAAFHLRVIKYEEPRLAQQFGRRWTLYKAMTNRWLPKLR